MTVSVFNQVSTRTTMNVIKHFAMLAKKGEKNLEDVKKEEFLEQMVKEYIDSEPTLMQDRIKAIEAEHGDKLPAHIEGAIMRFRANVCRIDLPILAEKMKQNGIIITRKNNNVAVNLATDSIEGIEERTTGTGKNKKTVNTVNGEKLIGNFRFYSGGKVANKNLVDKLILESSLEGTPVYPEWMKLAELFSATSSNHRGRGRQPATVSQSVLDEFAL